MPLSSQRAFPKKYVNSECLNSLKVLVKLYVNKSRIRCFWIRQYPNNSHIFRVIDILADNFSSQLQRHYFCNQPFFAPYFSVWEISRGFYSQRREPSSSLLVGIGLRTTHIIWGKHQAQGWVQSKPAPFHSLYPFHLSLSISFLLPFFLSLSFSLYHSLWRI